MGPIIFTSLDGFISGLPYFTGSLPSLMVRASLLESAAKLIWKDVAVQGLKYVTRFSCETFGFYVSAVYVQYGIQVVTRQFRQTSTTSAFLGIM